MKQTGNRPRILLCGHNLFGYLDSIARGFEQLECDTAVFAHRNINVRKLEYRNWLKRQRAALRLHRLNRTLLETWREFKPDLVLCINGEALLPETVLALGRRAVTALWIVDGLHNLKLPLSTIQLFAHLFVFEPADCRHLPGATYLPYGADEQHYFPTGAEPEFDVTFVGSPHESRLPILERVAAAGAAEGWRVGVFGPFRRFRKPASRLRLRQAYPALAAALVRNDRLEPAAVNDIFNRSRINLNIHHDQSVEGVNPRTFEIPAAGGFQLVDAKPQLTRWFVEGDTMATYATAEMLPARIRHYLDHTAEREHIAAAARRLVRAEHRFRDRCRTLLTHLPPRPRSDPAPAPAKSTTGPVTPT